MKRLIQVKGKLSLLLILAISLLCAGFFIVSCGKPQQKTKNSDKGSYAIDFRRCPSGKSCSATPKGSEVNPVPNISRRAVTLEAWIKTSVDTTSGNIFKRSDGSKGVELYIENTGPKFIIRRFPIAGDVPLAQRTALSECVQMHATSTECVVPAITQVGTSTPGVAALFTIPTTTPTSTLTISSPIFVNSATIISSFTDIVGNIIALIGETANSIIVPVQTVTVGSPTTTFNVTNVTAIKAFPQYLEEDSWTHIAGVITSTDQSTGPNNCAVDTDGDGKLQGKEAPHLAIYINGNLINCASTGGDGVFADNPANEDIVIGPLNGGVIDELRFWVPLESNDPPRTKAQINNCMNTELGIGGECDRGDPELAAYYRLNEGEGADVTDFSGNGFSGGFEFTVAPQVFEAWEDGWVLRTDDKTPARAE